MVPTYYDIKHRSGRTTRDALPINFDATVKQHAAAISAAPFCGMAQLVTAARLPAATSQALRSVRCHSRKQSTVSSEKKRLSQWWLAEGQSGIPTRTYSAQGSAANGPLSMRRVNQ